MSNGESSDERAAREKVERSLQEIEAAAAELVQVGEALFRRGEPADPALLRRYRLYKRVQAALALSAGPERVAALRAAKVDDDKKHLSELTSAHALSSISGHCGRTLDR
jgi:hypothetical protein